jgi:hypothetical protein
MIKRADASSIKREKATKEQIAENFKRLATDSTKKVELKPSILKTVKSLDGKTFGIIHENKTYYLKYTVKKGTNNPVDFKHLDSLNSSFGIEKHNSFEKAVNKMNFICEAQNNAHKLRLLNEAEEDIMDDNEKEDTTEKVTSDSTEDTLLKNLDKEKASADDMGGEMPPADMGGDMGAAPAGEEPIDTTKTGGAEPQEIATDILGNLDKEKAPAADMGGEAPAGEEPAAPEGGEEKDLNDEIQSKLGETQELIGDLKRDETKYDSSFIKTTINSLLGYWGDALKELDSDDIKDIKDRLEGSQVDEKPSTEKTETSSVEDVPAEAQLDENFLRQLKAESKRLLKEQLEQEIIKRKRNILIEGIKRKLK